MLWGGWACVPLLLSLCSRAHAPQGRVARLHCNRRRAVTAVKSQHGQKYITKQNYLKKKSFWRSLCCTLHRKRIALVRLLGLHFACLINLYWDTDADLGVYFGHSAHVNHYHWLGRLIWRNNMWLEDEGCSVIQKSILHSWDFVGDTNSDSWWLSRKIYL